jgi:hypothetical protein
MPPPGGFVGLPIGDLKVEHVLIFQHQQSEALPICEVKPLKLVRTVELR